MTEKDKPKRRPVGRPREYDEAVRVNIYLPRVLREKLMRLGGSKWIVEQLRKTP